MAHGLEVRVPMLGQPVLDAVLTLPASAHLSGGSKRLLTDLAKRDLPETVWNRDKHGFSVPLQPLFNGSWHAVCENSIRNIGVNAPFLDADSVCSLWRQVGTGKGSRRLMYTLIVLLIWLERKDVSFS